ncbi:MAG: Trafficking protein particle complex subunit 33, partial [Thelocarpon superellum]
MSFDTPIPPYNASDPHATFLNSSCLDLLLIELVPMAQRLAHEVAARTKDGGVGVGVGVGVAVDAETTTTSNNSSGGGGAAGDAIKNNEKNDGSKTVVKMLEDDEARDAVFFRLEALGYRVGQGLAERFTRERPRFTDSLDVIKFLCKDLWTLVFRKQVDNLKTNHR